MAVSSLGVGSGLDLQSLADGLLAAEKSVAEASLNRREFAATEKLSAYGLLKSSVSLFNGTLTSLGDITTFQSRSATSSNDNAFTVSAQKDAVLGSFALTVVASGESHVLQSTGLVDITNTAVASAATAIGGGTLLIGQGSQPSFSVSIDSANSSLTDIANAINSAEGNTGVQVSVIVGDNGPVLIVSSTNVGSDNQITLTVNDVDGNDADALGLSQLTFDINDIAGSNLTQQAAAIDAQITVDGQVVTSTSGNTFANVLQGVTITALQETTVTETLTITKDISQATTAVNNFIKEYNSLVESIDELGRAGSQDGTVSAGALVGDSVVRSLESQLRRSVFSQIKGTQPLGVQSLSDIGVRVGENGGLSLDSAIFDLALENNFDDVARLLAADGDPVDQANQLRSAGFAAVSTVVGDGGLTLQVGEDSFSVTISATVNDSLQGIRDAINNAVDNTGVTASLILVDDGGGGTEVQLVLTANEVGKAVSVTATDNDGNDIDANGLSTLTSNNLIQTVASQIDTQKGVIELLKVAVEGFLGVASKGIIDTRTDGLNSDVQRVSDDRLALDRRLEQIQDRLTARFAALDLLVANLSSSGDFLLSQLSTISNISNNNNS